MNEVEAKRNELAVLLETNEIENPMLEAKYNQLYNACNTRKVSNYFCSHVHYVRFFN